MNLEFLLKYMVNNLILSRYIKQNYVKFNWNPPILQLLHHRMKQHTNQKANQKIQSIS